MERFNEENSQSPVTSEEKQSSPTKQSNFAELGKEEKGLKNH